MPDHPDPSQPSIEVLMQHAQDLLERFLEAEDQEAFLRDHLEAFDDQVLAVYAAWARDAEEKGQHKIAQLLTGIIMEVGMARMGQDPRAQTLLARMQRLIAATSLVEVEALLEEWPELLAPQTKVEVENLVAAARQMGEQAAIQQGERVLAWLDDLRQRHPLLAAMLDFVATDTWDQARKLAQRTPHLHTPDALRLLDDLARKARERGDEDLAATYTRHRERLARWQKTNFAPELPSIPDDLRAALDELVQLQGRLDRASLERLRALSRALLRQMERSSSPEPWAALQVTLGNASLRLFEMINDAALAAEVEAAYRRALKVYTREASPPDWAMTQNNLANLYARMYERTGEARYAHRAEEAYRRALEVYTKEASPPLWATTQNNLGLLYLQMYRSRGEVRYAYQAEAAYRRALEVYTKEASPPQWAMTQNNLANLYLDLYERTGEVRYVYQAEAAYRRALEVYTKEASPSQWAAIQNNQGNLYRNLYERTGEARYVHLAEAAYRRALEVYTKEASPPDWAMTQNNLANLYARMYERTGEARYAQWAEATMEKLAAKLKVERQKLVDAGLMDETRWQNEMAEMLREAEWAEWKRTEKMKWEDFERERKGAAARLRGELERALALHKTEMIAIRTDAELTNAEKRAKMDVELARYEKQRREILLAIEAAEFDERLRQQKAEDEADLQTATKLLEQLRKLKVNNLGTEARAREIARQEELKRQAMALKGEKHSEKASTTQAYAVAQIDGLSNENEVMIGQQLILEAGILSTPPIEMPGRTRMVESNPIQIPQIPTIQQFEITVYAEDMNIRPSWIQSVIFKHNDEPELAQFVLIPQQIGAKKIRIDYYQNRHWLTQIIFEVTVVKVQENILEQK